MSRGTALLATVDECSLRQLGVHATKKKDMLCYEE